VASSDRSKHVVAGVDLGGTKIQTVAMRAGNVAGKNRVLTPRTGDANDVLEAIVSSVQSSLAEAGSAVEQLEAVGIGTPGEVDEVTGVVSLAANVPGFEGRVQLGPYVSQTLGGVPVTVANDVNVAVLGEYRRGAGRPEICSGSGSEPVSAAGSCSRDLSGTGVARQARSAIWS
jgi:glucokinase